MTDITCNGKTARDCEACNAYSSSHSLHYSASNKRHVSNINCSIGGFREFDEDGKRIS